MDSLLKAMSSDLQKEVLDHLKYYITIDEDGAERWRLNGKLHREDGPAVIYPNGTQVWYRNGLRHREDGPAVIREDGIQWWYRNGKCI
jgi:hypothetical protein